MWIPLLVSYCFFLPGEGAGWDCTEARNTGQASYETHDQCRYFENRTAAIQMLQGGLSVIALGVHCAKVLEA